MSVKGLAIPERRRQPRVRARVSLGVMSGGHVIIAPARDFSSGGAFIEAPLALPVGGVVHIFITVPGLEQAVRLTGTVARVEPGGIALQFEPLSGEESVGLERFLASLES